MAYFNFHEKNYWESSKLTDSKVNPSRENHAHFIPCKPPHKNHPREYFGTTLWFIQIATSVVEKSQILSVAFHLSATVGRSTSHHWKKSSTLFLILTPPWAVVWARCVCVPCHICCKIGRQYADLYDQWRYFLAKTWLTHWWTSNSERYQWGQRWGRHGGIQALKVRYHSCKGPSEEKSKRSTPPKRSLECASVKHNTNANMTSSSGLHYILCLIYLLWRHSSIDNSILSLY